MYEHVTYIYIIECIHCWCNFTKHELEGTLVLVCADVARCFCQVGIESRQRWVWLLLHKSLFDRSHDANICQQIRHFGNIQQKECFSPVQNASGVENPHIFLNIEHCKWQQRVPHSFAAIAAIAMLFRKGCVLSWVRQKVSQVSKIASSCFKNLNNPGNPNRATHYRYLQIVFIFTSDGLQQSHVFLCASVALETRRGNFAPPPPWDF